MRTGNGKMKPDETRVADFVEVVEVLGAHGESLGNGMKVLCCALTRECECHLVGPVRLLASPKD